MADGFSELEEVVMAILVRERKSATQVIADTVEIVGKVKAHCAIAAESMTIPGHSVVEPLVRAIVRKIRE